MARGQNKLRDLLHGGDALATGRETDRLKAFTAAKRRLREKHPGPFHWAPFHYIGSPD